MINAGCYHPKPDPFDIAPLPTLIELEAAPEPRTEVAFAYKKARPKSVAL
jgi:hypothetical protein